MSRAVKFRQFLIAVVTMAFFALSAIVMAENHWLLGMLLIVLALLFAVLGFVMKRRALKGTGKQ